MTKQSTHLLLHLLDTSWLMRDEWKWIHGAKMTRCRCVIFDKKWRDFILTFLTAANSHVNCRCLKDRLDLSSFSDYSFQLYTLRLGTLLVQKWSSELHRRSKFCLMENVPKDYSVRILGITWNYGKLLRLAKNHVIYINHRISDLFII